MELVPEPKNPNAVWTAAKKELESITRRVAGTFADVFDELERFSSKLLGRGGVTTRGIVDKTAKGERAGSYANLSDPSKRSEAYINRRKAASQLEYYNIYGWMSKATKNAIANSKSMRSMNYLETKPTMRNRPDLGAS
jgi:hypothetical protein